MFRRLRHVPLCCEALMAVAQARFRLLRGTLATCGAIVNRPSSLKPNQIAWAIKRTAPLIPRSTCLVRAMAAHDLLTRNGYASTLHIGVANSKETGFEAHAWVEYNGAILVGRTDTQYTPLLNWNAAE